MTLNPNTANRVAEEAEDKLAAVMAAHTIQVMELEGEIARLRSNEAELRQALTDDGLVAHVVVPTEVGTEDRYMALPLGDDGGLLVVVHAGSADNEPTPDALDTLCEVTTRALDVIVPKGTPCAVMSLRYDIEVKGFLIKKP